MEIRKIIEALLGRDEVARLVPGRILAVDDDEGNLAILEDLLMDDYEVVAVDNPAEAIEQLQKQTFDVVLSDQRMPHMTGVELLARVRKHSPDTIRIIVSAYSDSKEILCAINKGEVFRYVLKPWDPDDMEAVVQQGIQHRFQVLAIRRLVGELQDRNVTLEDTLGRLRQAQEQVLHSAKLATIGQLTAGIAHELRNHVAGIRMAYEMMQTLDVPGHLSDCVALGARSASTLNQLVGVINSYARKGAYEINPRPEEPGAMLEETLGMVRMDKRMKKRHLEVRMPPEVPRVRADGEKIRQVLLNVVRNAVDATGDGDSIHVVVEPEEGGRLWFRVRDTGCGMPEEVRQRVFQPFFTTKENGLGLGLDICRQIVEAHAGEMTIDSEEGSGTTVSVSLPIAS